MKSKSPRILHREEATPDDWLKQRVDVALTDPCSLPESCSVGYALTMPSERRKKYAPTDMSFGPDCEVCGAQFIIRLLVD